MKFLAIETSCDDTSVAIVDSSRNVLGVKTLSQVEHAKFGGVVPEVASRHHENSILEASLATLEMANLSVDNVDAVCVASNPGLIGSLLVGISFAHGVSLALNVPLIEVNHIESHAISAVINNENLDPPFVSLVVSGGHTSVIDVESFTKYKTYFHTIDDAVGEVLDKVAREMGISYPGGATLDSMALQGNKNFFQMPRPKISNFSFSGIKTWAMEIVKKLDPNHRNDLASSLVFGISEYISDYTLKIAKKLGRKQICMGGGVAASKVLRQTLAKMCAENNVNLFFPDVKYCQDNAAMIGIRGMFF